MASYLILIYNDESAWRAPIRRRPRRTSTPTAPSAPPTARRSAAATRCSRPRRRPRSADDPSGELTVTDGPFAETKEALGGYYLIEAADLDEAIAIAKQVPVVRRRRRGAPDHGVRLSPQAVAGSALAAAVADAHRREWAFVLAATVRVTRDLDLAEECVQDAYARALASWARSGIPDRPGAWLTTVARRRALDLRRRDAHARALARRCCVDDRRPSPSEEPPHEVADDRLRLIFTCCHPALAPHAQVALTLRLVCGLRTAEVARAFLVSEPTMAARITRAKKKIAAARIPYRVPRAEELPARIDAVLSVVHLVFTTGPHGAGRRAARAPATSSSARSTSPGCCARCSPADREVAGLLALILLTDARSADAGLGRRASCVLLADQDRSRWDREAIAEGRALVREALRRRPPGRFALMAAIAAVHAEAASFEQTDWREIVALYDLLGEIWPSPVVALNRAAAIGFADGPAAGLAALDALAAEPRARDLPLSRRRARRLPAPARARRGGARRLRGGAAADRERRRAGVPRRPPGSARRVASGAGLTALGRDRGRYRGSVTAIPRSA